MNAFSAKLKYFDLPLLAAVGLLSVSGLALSYSGAVSAGDFSGFFRQLVFFATGILGFAFFSFFDYHVLAKKYRWVYIPVIAALLYVLFLGPEIRGGRRWITLGFFQIQPAEFAKLAVIFALSRLLYAARGSVNSVKVFLQSVFLASLPAVLVLKEPDLGSALVIFAIWGGTLTISPIRKKFLVMLLVLAVAVSGVSWKFFLKDFQKDRVATFLNPELDPLGRGYNVRQATIAIGSGSLWGRGFGKGLQSGNKFLPENQTDFIFAAAAEEVGFAGTASLLGLYFLLMYRILLVMQKAKDDTGMYLACGAFFLIASHTVVNIGMNMGLLPVTGIPLPFLSAGGSALVADFIAMGVVENIALQTKMLRF